MEKELKFHFKEPQKGLFNGKVEDIYCILTETPATTTIDGVVYIVVSDQGSGIILPIKETEEEVKRMISEYYKKDKREE